MVDQELSFEAAESEMPVDIQVEVFRAAVWSLWGRWLWEALVSV